MSADDTDYGDRERHDRILAVAGLLLAQAFAEDLKGLDHWQNDSPREAEMRERSIKLATRYAHALVNHVIETS